MTSPPPHSTLFPYTTLFRSRFEITRAQFAAFDSTYKFAPGTENFPANNITFDRAKAYADWLSRMTGQNWRVPNETEVASLDRKSTRLNSSHMSISYAVFCLK